MQTIVVAPAEGGTRASYPGQTVSRYEAQLGFRIAGRLIAKLVDVGATVNAGQVLARLDPSDAQLSAQSAIAQAQAANSAADQQSVDLKRAQRLLGEGFISQAEFDRQKVAADQARAQLRSARTQVQGARNQVDYTILRADRAGVVTVFSGDVGQILPAGQPVVTVAQPNALDAEDRSPEREVSAFRGAVLRVRLWAQPNRVFPGRIRTISPAADPQTRTFAARVAFDPGPGSAVIGATAEVMAINRVDRAAQRVPVSALTQSGGRPAVWIVKGDPATVQPRAVSVIQVQDNAVLLGSGLKPGERIVVAGVQLLHPGEHVRIAPERQADR